MTVADLWGLALFLAVVVAIWWTIRGRPKPPRGW